MHEHEKGENELKQEHETIKYVTLMQSSVSQREKFPEPISCCLFLSFLSLFFFFLDE